MSFSRISFNDVDKEAYNLSSLFSCDPLSLFLRTLSHPLPDPCPDLTSLFDMILRTLLSVNAFKLKGKKFIRETTTTLFSHLFISSCFINNWSILLLKEYVYSPPSPSTKEIPRETTIMDLKKTPNYTQDCDSIVDKLLITIVFMSIFIDCVFY